MTSSPALPATTATADRRWPVPLALVSLYLVWGSTYLAIRFALASWPPFLMASVRFAFAGALLYGVLRLRGAPAPTLRQWRNAAIVGSLLLLGGNGLVCYAEQSVSSGIAAVAVASMPLFATLFNGLYGEWPQRRELVGLAIGFAGVVVLNLGSSLSGSHLGALALVCAAAFWAFGSSWSRRQDMPAGAMNTAAQMLCASVALAVTAGLTGERLPAHPSLHATMAIVYLALFGSIVGFSAYMYLLRTVRPALSTSYAYVNPPVAVLFGVMLGGEHVGPVDMAGMGIILLGVAIVIFSRNKVAVPPPPAGPAAE